MHVWYTYLRLVVFHGNNNVNVGKYIKYMINIPYMDGKGMENTFDFLRGSSCFFHTTLEVVADVKIVGNLLDDFKPFLILGLQDPSESGILKAGF